MERMYSMACLAAKKVRIGIIGCGNISGKHMESLNCLFENTLAYAIGDMDFRNAEKRAEEYNISHVCKSNEELLSMDEVEIVVVLTNPSSLCAARLSMWKFPLIWQTSFIWRMG